MTRTVIEDEFADFEIDGEVIAGPVSTEIDAAGRARPRWYQVTLYAKPEGGYVLHQVNLSRVWHVSDGHVRKPGVTERAALPPDAVYCGSLPGRDKRCPVLRQGAGGDRMAITELPQHKVSGHPDASAVVREALTARRGSSVSMALSEPMRLLLVEAEEKDPAFRGVRPVVRMLCRLLQALCRLLRTQAAKDQERG